MNSPRRRNYLSLKISTESILYPKPILLPHQAWSQLCCLQENGCDLVVSWTSQTERLKSTGKREMLYLLTFCSPMQISKEKKDEEKYFDKVTFCFKILFYCLLNVFAWFGTISIRKTLTNICNEVRKQIVNCFCR